MSAKKLLVYEEVYDIESGCVIINEKVCKELQQLAEIIANKHFSYVRGYDREDIISEGVLKGLNLLEQGDYDPDRAILKNYIYTGMRNEMTNYLYRENRSVAVDEFFNLEAEGFYEHKVELYFEDIKSFINGLFNIPSRYARKLANFLASMGFNIQNAPKIESRNEEDLNDSLCEKLVVMFLWKIQESSL